MLKEENMNRKEGYMLKEKVVEDIKQKLLRKEKKKKKKKKKTQN